MGGSHRHGTVVSGLGKLALTRNICACQFRPKALVNAHFFLSPDHSVRSARRPSSDTLRATSRRCGCPSRSRRLARAVPCPSTHRHRRLSAAAPRAYGWGRWGGMERCREVRLSAWRSPQLLEEPPRHDRVALHLKGTLWIVGRRTQSPGLRPRAGGGGAVKRSAHGPTSRSLA